MKIVLTLILTLSIGFSHSAKAFWGNPADTAYLAQILAQAIAQLQQLKMILKDGQDSLNLMRDVNAGIFDTLKILKSVAGPMNPGLYGELSKVEDVAHKIQELYGTIANSPLKESQSKTDQAVSEAISFNNDLYRYSKDLDQVGEEIKLYADQASPGRAIFVDKSWNSKNGVKSTKSGKSRVIPISDDLLQFLKELKLQSTPDSAYVLPRLTEWTRGEQARVLKAFCKSSGITPVRFHDLRATFITNLLAQGVSLARVMAVVGHTQIDTTNIYLRKAGIDLKGVTNELGYSIPSDQNAQVLKLADFRGTLNEVTP